MPSFVGASRPNRRSRRLPARWGGRWTRSGGEPLPCGSLCVRRSDLGGTACHGGIDVPAFQLGTRFGKLRAFSINHPFQDSPVA